jgi:hypothetical protein
MTNIEIGSRICERFEYLFGCIAIFEIRRVEIPVKAKETDVLNFIVTLSGIMLLSTEISIIHPIVTARPTKTTLTDASSIAL